MDHGDLGGEEPNMNLIVGVGAVSKHEYVGVGNLTFDLSAPFPPPAHHIYAIRVLSKQAGEGFRIVVVPSLLQACFHVPYCSSFVLALVRAECSHDCPPLCFLLPALSCGLLSMHWKSPRAGVRRGYLEVSFVRVRPGLNRLGSATRESWP